MHQVGAVTNYTTMHGQQNVMLVFALFTGHEALRESKLKGKGKGRVSGFIRHCGFVKPIVPSPLGLPSFTTRGAVYQSDTQRTLLAEEGTNGIWPAISEFTKRAGLFCMPQSWDMGQIILLPLRRKACSGFFQQKKSDGFGSERTRDLGYQRPAC
jgi:hypothetical protein